jgi:hypothetical protein
MNYIKILLLAAVLLSAPAYRAIASGADRYVYATPSGEWMKIVHNGQPVPILSDASDKGVLRAVENLRDDFRRVTGIRPSSETLSSVIIIGTAGNSALIDRLIRDNRIDGSLILGKREKYIATVIDHPSDGIGSALVIAGSDRRGTIYGIYELSAQIGVSPWYYWADVPVSRHDNLSIKPGIYTEGEPAVRYRGIFLNDEAPALRGWSETTFGGFNHTFYEKVFELILRLKGNFLWPAMWQPTAFYDDDPLNGEMADEYGIVIGTSHHEPLGRAHDEWRRYGKGEWNYERNADELRRFWTAGVQRSQQWEALYTVGMRGDGDMPMTRDANVALLRKIVDDQRSILSKVMKKKASDVPQVWALYKEVQEYYDQGMRVPDDITLMLCDDNWGNVRKLPRIGDPPRKGGFGMYYHFDYVGGPRNYKWINVTQVQRIWEQMNLTYEHGVDRIWIVNVGDLKPMEYPITFFLDMAWKPSLYNAGNLLQHTQEWCSRQFGEEYAVEAARLINLYTKYNRRVTPELLNDRTYSLDSYGEFAKVTDEYRALLMDAMRLYNLMPASLHDSFDQLVLFPINACCNLYEMYYAVAMNRQAAANSDARAANFWADKVRECYDRDSILTDHYNNHISGGKWAHIMDQIRIGYTFWQQPASRSIPRTSRMEAADSRIFLETDGYVAIEAEHFSSKKEEGGIRWTVIPDLGKTLSAVTTMPVTTDPSGTGSVLEYTIKVETTGEFPLTLLLSPTLSYNANKGLRYAVSIDGADEQTVNFNGGASERSIGQWQATSIIESVTRHRISTPGIHTIRFRALDSGILLQKLLLDTGNLKRTYLGAPESPLYQGEK